MTDLAEDEVLTAVEFPTARPGDGFGFGEIARRHGDFALAGVVVWVRLTKGRAEVARLTAFGVADRPITADVRSVVDEALTAVGGAAPVSDLERRLAGSLGDVTAAQVTTAGDVHGSAGYRRRILAALAAREVARAVTAAGTVADGSRR
jgi:carbon-monoxide dehydrogenase medium subunit